jgi:osmotically-inducible protein OsmY
MNPEPSDLVQRVRAALEDDSRTQDAALDIVDESGVLTLTGTVASDDVRQAAEEIAHQQEGVLQVVNQLRIAEGDPEANLPPVAPPAHDIHRSFRGA